MNIYVLVKKSKFKINFNNWSRFILLNFFANQKLINLLSYQVSGHDVSKYVNFQI